MRGAPVIEKIYKGMEYSLAVAGGNGACFSPSSAYLGYCQGKTLVLKLPEAELPDLARIHFAQSITSFEISPNSELVAILLQKSSTIMVYRILEHERKVIKVSLITDQKNGITSFYWARDSSQIVVFNQFMYKATVFDLGNQQAIILKEPKTNQPQGAAFDRDGDYMALLEKHEGKDFLSIYYCHGWHLLNCNQLDLFDAEKVIWSLNSSYLAVVDSHLCCRLLIFEPLKGQVLKYQPYNLVLGVKSVQFSPCSRFLAVGFYDESIRILNTVSWAQIATLDCSSLPKDSNRVSVVKGAEGKMEIPLNQQKNTKPKPSQREKDNFGIGMLQFSQDTQFIACQSDKMSQVVWIWSVADMELVTALVCKSTVRSVKWNMHGSLGIACAKEMLIWTPGGSVSIHPITQQGRLVHIENVSWDKDGGKAIIGGKGEFVVAWMCQ